MKKHLISAALAVLLMFTIATPASADPAYYPAPGDIEAGRELNHLAATVDSSSAISAVGNLPAGVSMVTEAAGENDVNVYLRGTPMLAGSYSFILSINGESALVCTLNVLPARPTVSISGNISCLPGQSALISVSASAADGGSLSYQWYSASLPDGGDGEAIPGAVGPEYAPDTSAAGKRFYFCTVTNTNNGISSESRSGVCAVEVLKGELSSISVETPPAVTEYESGGSFSAEGLSIRLNFADGSTGTITEGYELKAPVFDAPGKYEVIVSYGGKSCSFYVHLKEENETVTGISIIKQPEKTVYLVGEELDARGLAIRVYTGTGPRNLATGFICDPVIFDSPGSHSVTVSYGGKSSSFTVQVFEKEQPASLEIIELPEKLSYYSGEELDTDGLVLLLRMNTGRTELVRSGFTAGSIDESKTGSQEIELSYAGLSCSFTVELIEKPVPSPASGEDKEEEVREDSAAGSVPAIIATVSVAAAIGGLCFYAMRPGQIGSGLGEKLKKFFSRSGKKK